MPNPNAHVDPTALRRGKCNPKDAVYAIRPQHQSSTRTPSIIITNSPFHHVVSSTPSIPPLLGLHPDLRLLRALPRPRLPLEPPILARPILDQPLRILDRAVDAPAVNPEAHAHDEAPLCELPDETDPEHDGAIEHAEDLEGEPEDGDEGEDGGDVGLGDDLGDERGEVGGGGAVDAEEGGYEVDEGVGEGGGEEVVEQREVVWGGVG